MPAKVEPGKASRPPVRRVQSHARVRYRAPFALRCGAILIDYILLALILTFSTIIARTMGGGARLAGGTAEKVGILFTLVAAVLDLGVLAGLTGKTVGKWTTGLRLERTDGRLPGFGRAMLRHFVGYPVSLLVLGIGFLIAIVIPNGRALHDFIAGTVVIREYGGSKVVRKPGQKL
ncbi:MAG: RDD family protein [Pyrinomonadaceae bacterium]